MTRLASLQTITEVRPIEGADRIEQIKVLGWSLVARKGEFKAGDLCVFFEIDSVLPEDAPWAQFMKDRKFRVKTAKMRGVLSQGLALPLDILPSGFDCTMDALKPGVDVSEVLGVKHYEKPEAGGVIGGMSAGPFPPIPKTDEPRLQSAPGLLDELHDKAFYVTVKIDGSSGTFAKLHSAFGPYKQGDLLVCTRTRSIKRPEKENNAFWSVADKYRLAEVLPEGYAIQGEVAGPKIQRNRLELKEHDLFVFNVFDMQRAEYLSHPEMIGFCLRFGLHPVPIVTVYAPLPDKTGWVSDAGKILHPAQDEFLALAEGYYNGTKNRREGIVVRTLKETRSETLGGSRFSFKVVNNTYLLKDED